MNLAPVVILHSWSARRRLSTTPVTASAEAGLHRGGLALKHSCGILVSYILEELCERFRVLDLLRAGSVDEVVEEYIAVPVYFGGDIQATLTEVGVIGGLLTIDDGGELLQSVALQNHVVHRDAGAMRGVREASYTNPRDPGLEDGMRALAQNIGRCWIFLSAGSIAVGGLDFANSVLDEGGLFEMEWYGTMTANASDTEGMRLMESKQDLT